MFFYAYFWNICYIFVIYLYSNIRTMDITVKKQTAFRLSSDLLDKLRSAAKKEHRSLNNFVECALMDIVCNKANEETTSAINEARTGKYAGEIDMKSFDTFMKSVNDIE